MITVEEAYEEYLNAKKASAELEQIMKPSFTLNDGEKLNELWNSPKTKETRFKLCVNIQFDQYKWDIDLILKALNKSVPLSDEDWFETYKDIWNKELNNDYWSFQKPI